MARKPAPTSVARVGMAPDYDPGPSEDRVESDGEVATLAP